MSRRLEPTGLILPERGDSNQAVLDLFVADIKLLNEYLQGSFTVTTAGGRSFSRVELPTNWGNRNSKGEYSQAIAMPSVNGTPLNYDNVNIIFRNATGEKVYLKAVKQTNSTYILYTNTIETFFAYYQA